MNETRPPDCFDLNHSASYEHWRERKCAAYPIGLDLLTVDVGAADCLTEPEKTQLQAMLDTYNMVIYRTPDLTENKTIPLSLGHHFGLRTLDGNLGAGADAVTEIKVKQTGVHGRYIPYTPKKLSWHTDGYYNRLDKQIRGMSLHCVRPAGSGGENALLDNEMAYIYLRDLDLAHIKALSQPDVMTIPANIVAGRVLRDTQTGPVFSFDDKGYLHMRYTARKRNIEWKDTPEVARAVAALEAMFDDCEWVLRGSLAAGEGLICNNVLHNRSGFQDDANAPRLLYRLRYYERTTSASRINVRPS